MKIGKRLKQVRISQNKSQKEMVGDIFDRSFYSRVEGDKNQINMSDLLKIIHMNNNSVTDFLQGFGDLEPQNSIYQEKVEKAFFSRDVVELENISTNETQVNRVIREVAKLLMLKLEKNLQNIPKNHKDKFKKHLFKLYKWDENSLWVLSLVMDLYSFKELQGLIESVFDKYNCMSVINQRDAFLLARISINYLKFCFKQTKADRQVKRTLRFLHSLPTTSDNSFYKILGTYYESLNMSGENNQVIIKVLTDLGYENYLSASLDK